MIIVSVLITLYNRKDLIRETLDSVLQSAYKDFEVIVVDDCSTDDSYAVALEYAEKDARVRVFKNETNLGDYKNRNKAASYAQGKYIKYVDSDDIMYAHCLQVMVEAMETYPEAGFALCAKTDYYNKYPMLLSSKEAYKEHFEEFGHFDRAPGSAIIKKEVFDKVGGFSGERMIGDFDLWFRIAMYYPMVKMVTGLYWSRIHEAQESQTDYAREQYAALRNMVIERYFAHKDCPITESEKNKYRQQIKRYNRFSAVKQFAQRLIR